MKEEMKMNAKLTYHQINCRFALLIILIFFLQNFIILKGNAQNSPQNDSLEWSQKNVLVHELQRSQKPLPANQRVVRLEIISSIPDANVIYNIKPYIIPESERESTHIIQQAADMRKYIAFREQHGQVQNNINDLLIKHQLDQVADFIQQQVRLLDNDSNPYSLELAQNLREFTYTLSERYETLSGLYLYNKKRVCPFTKTEVILAKDVSANPTGFANSPPPSAPKQNFPQTQKAPAVAQDISNEYLKNQPAQPNNSYQTGIEKTAELKLLPPAKKKSQKTNTTPRRYNGYTALDFKNLGNQKFNQGSYQSAINYYCQAIYMDNNFADAYFNRGLAFMRAGNNPDQIAACEQAVKDFAKVVQLRPNDQQAMQLLSSTKLDLARLKH